MAARRGNKRWLQQQLAKHLQWDAETAESVVEALAGSSTREEADTLVEAYMGGQAAARQAALQFLGPANRQPAAAAAAAGPGMQLYQRDESLRQLESTLVPGGGASSSSSGGGSRGGRPAVAVPQAVELPSAAEQAKSQLNLGRNVEVSVKPARKKGSGGGGGTAGAAGSEDKDKGRVRQLARPVVNCLRCGKIYDCRELVGEPLRFLDSGGICSFCGHRVTLHYADGSTNEPAGGEEGGAPDAAATAAAGPSSGNGAGGGAAGELAGFKPEREQANAADAVSYNASAAAAVELRDRLVQYDRESAKRTTVLDDQSDFFAIDSNAWLSDEERAVLRQREREMAEAEEARRRRVTVTVDLLGRKVILDGSIHGDAEGAAAAAAAETEAQLEAARAAATARAAAATAAEAALGGVAAAPAALAAVEEKLRDLRITVNPSMAARHFVFLPQQQQAQQQQGQQQAAGGAGRQQAGGRGQRQQRQPNAAPCGVSRLQHDDPFIDLEMEAVAEAEAVLAADEARRRVPAAAAGVAMQAAS